MLILKETLFVLCVIQENNIYSPVGFAVLLPVTLSRLREGVVHARA